jgi:hypothetical protein
MKLSDLEEYVEHFRGRVVQDALAEATAVYWRRRAEAFRDALPREGDFLGKASPAEVEDQRRRVAQTILACCQRAGVMLGGEIE